MGAMSVRNVSMSSLSTRVPRADQRAGYMSLQSTAQHISSATGAFVSSRLLHEAPGGRLRGISTVSTISAVLALGLPPLLAAINKRVTAARVARRAGRSRERRRASPAGARRGRVWEPSPVPSDQNSSAPVNENTFSDG